MMVLSLSNMPIKCPMHKIFCISKLPCIFTGDVLPVTFEILCINFNYCIITVTLTHEQASIANVNKTCEKILNMHSTNILSQCKHQSANSTTLANVSITDVKVVQFHALKPCIHNYMLQ